MDLLWDRKVWPALTEAASVASSGTSRSVVAVAYVGRDAPDRLPLVDGDRLLVDATPAAVRAGVTSAAALRRYLDAGVDIRWRSGLHAKGYVLGRRGFVGSANTSASGLIECMVRLTDRGDVSQLRALLTTEHDKSRPLTDAGLARLEELRPRQGFTPRRDDNDMLDSTEALTRLRMWETTTEIWPASVERVHDATRRAARRAAGPASSWELTTEWLDPDDAAVLRPGTDGLVEIEERDGQVMAWPPARVLEVHPAGRYALAYLVRSSAADPIPWDELRAVVRSATGRALRSNSVVNDEAQLRAVLAAFAS